jgi:hypothetical protein
LVWFMCIASDVVMGLLFKFSLFWF